MLSSQFKKKTKKPILSSTVKYFSQSRSILENSDSNNGETIQAKKSNVRLAESKHETNDLRVRSKINSTETTTATTATTEKTKFLNNKFISNSDHNQCHDHQQPSENNDDDFSSNFCASIKIQEKDSSKFAFSFDINHEDKFTRPISTSNPKTKKRKSKKKKQNKRNNSYDNIEEENKRNIHLDENDGSYYELNLEENSGVFDFTFTNMNNADHSSEQNTITSKHADEYTRGNTSSKEPSHSIIRGEKYGTVSGTGILICTNTTLSPPPGFNEIPTAADISFRNDQVLQTDKIEWHQYQRNPTCENNETPFQYNAFDKGKAFINRGSLIVRKGKHRQPKRSILSDSAATHTLPRDMSPNAFSFGFDFEDVLANKRK